MRGFVIALVCLIGASVAHPPDGSCGPFPTKMPTDCCPELKKLCKEDLHSICEAECGVKDMCCEGNCFAKNMGFLKDGKFDKDTAQAALKTAFEGDSTMFELATKSLTECISEVAAGKPPGPPPPMQHPCPTVENGITTFCIKKKLFLGCPKPQTDAECEKTKAFFTCLK